jgi:hypothetical protein
MVAKRGTKASTRKKLKLKKETLKSLDAKGKASKVKGGMRGSEWAVCTIACTVLGVCK